MLYDTEEAATALPTRQETPEAAKAVDRISTRFVFDSYTSNIVVSSYNHLHAQLAQQQKLISQQISGLVRSYLLSTNLGGASSTFKKEGQQTAATKKDSSNKLETSAQDKKA